MIEDEDATMESSYLDRLGYSERLDVWRAEELTAALGVIDTIAGQSRRPAGEAAVLDIRLQIYRHRLRRELDQRAADHEVPPES